MLDEPTPERPVYTKFRQEWRTATNLFGVSCNEGWRSTVVCSDMYEWAADWLVEVLQGQPFAPGRRP